MTGERPWWLPTAVFVAPVCALAFWLGVEFEDALPWPVVGAISLIALISPFIDLARREDRHSDERRPAELNRWGFDREVQPWRGLGQVSLAGGLLIGVLAGYVVVVSEAVDSARPLLFVVGVVFVGGAAATWWWLVAKSGVQWDKRPEWQTAFVRRWPITASFGIVVVAGAWLAMGAWAVSQGQWWPVIPLLLFFARPFVRALIRLVDSTDPDRNWGQRMSAPPR